jgi:hypothetical protein
MGITSPDNKGSSEANLIYPNKPLDLSKARFRKKCRNKRKKDYALWEATHNLSSPCGNPGRARLQSCRKAPKK